MRTAFTCLWYKVVREWTVGRELDGSRACPSCRDRPCHPCFLSVPRCHLRFTEISSDIWNMTLCEQRMLSA